MREVEGFMGWQERPRLCHQDRVGIRYTVRKCFGVDVCKMWWNQSNG
uniref:Uncharacterized protein n=1 Tax=Arundo donax TaxID=35708 RepID=A0A0A9H1E6_ARUDO